MYPFWQLRLLCPVAERISMRKKESSVERHERQKEKLINKGEIAEGVSEKAYAPTRSLKDEVVEVCEKNGFPCENVENVVFFLNGNEEEIKEFLLKNFGREEKKINPITQKEETFIRVPFSYGFNRAISKKEQNSSLDLE